MGQNSSADWIRSYRKHNLIHSLFYTLKTNVSLKTGLSVFLWTLVSNFFFLSGRMKTLTYGSEVPDMSIPGRSAAWITPTESYVWNIQECIQSHPLFTMTPTKRV